MHHDTTRRTLSATTLIGDDVHNHADEKLGTIEDIMLDLETGSIAYAVVDVSSWYEVADRLIAVPFGAMALDADEHRFLLDADRERLENAPGFDTANWPDFTDREWGASVHQHYRTTPYWQQ